MDRIKLRKHSRDRRRRGLQRRIRGSAARPRLAVFRSSKHIYAQVVDDLTGAPLPPPLRLRRVSIVPLVETSLPLLKWAVGLPTRQRSRCLRCGL